MAIYKAVKLEVLILTEPTQTDKEIAEWVRDAMTDYCEFTGIVVKIVEKHERVVTNFGDEPVA